MNKSPTKSYWGQLHLGMLLIAPLWMLVLLVEAQSFAPNARQYAPLQYQPLISAAAGLAGGTGSHRSSQDVLLYRGALLRKLQVRAEVTPQISPYNWHAQYDDGQLTISGHVPTRNDRDVIIEVAKATFVRSTIIDKMVVGRGEPYGWLATVTLAIRQLAMLEEGKASLEDTRLTIAGIAQRQETAELIRATLRTEMAAFYTAQHDIAFVEATIPVVKPFKSAITLKDNTLSLSGHIPDKVMLGRLIEAVKSDRPDAAIVNRMTIAMGAPEDWLNCTLAGLASLLELDEGNLEVVDSELTLTGLTRDEELGELLPKKLRAAVNRSCTETVKLLVEVPPEPNLDWHATYADNILAIAGEVPNSAVQNELIELAGKLFPQSKLLLNLRVNPGRSEKWPRVAKMALQSLAKLRNGEARLNAQTLTMTGEAEDTATATAIRQQLKAGIAKGYRAIAQIEVKSAAMLWAEREARRNEKTAPAQPQRDLTQIEADLRQVEKSRRRLNGKVAIRQTETAEGVNKAEERQQTSTKSEKIKSAVQPQQLQAKLQRCQKVLDEVMRTGAISFPVGSDKFKFDSLTTLERLKDLANPCKGYIEIEIAGHTDSYGSALSNRELSQRRAQMVRTYLIEQGMPAAQLSARGYGEMQPLVPNTTPANRARNRRIEFRAKINQSKL